MRPQPVCVGCLRVPLEIPEIVQKAWEDNISSDDYVWRQEGTLNTHNGHFLCDTCYIAWGQPSAPVSQGGWKAP